MSWYTVFDSAVSDEYAETAAGKTHTFTARSVRYVRDYLNGSTANTGNHWVELEVWGTRPTVYVGDYYELSGPPQTVDEFEYTDSPFNHGWALYDGSGSVSTVSGAGRPGRVLRTTTSQGTDFGIYYSASGWQTLCARLLSVWIKDSNTFYFYVYVRATNGNDYFLQYQPTTGPAYASGNYAIVPVGTQYADGTWRELRRDLDADLRAVFGVGVEYVKRFYIRGNYDLDSLVLIGHEARSYYYHNGQRVALRQGGNVYYLLGDHLGSTALAVDASGNKVSEVRYRAYGATRYAGGAGLPTSRRFTGQLEESTIGLYTDVMACQGGQVAVCHRVSVPSAGRRGAPARRAVLAAAEHGQVVVSPWPGRRSEEPAGQEQVKRWSLPGWSAGA